MKYGDWYATFLCYVREEIHLTSPMQMKKKTAYSITYEGKGNETVPMLK
jgi:hypothetical protein